MPLLDKAQAPFAAEGVQIIALAEDHDGALAISSFYRRRGLTRLTPYADSSGASLNISRINSLPTTVFIDAQGKEIGRVEGNVEWTREEDLAFARRVFAIP